MILQFLQSIPGNASVFDSQRKEYKHFLNLAQLIPKLQRFRRKGASLTFREHGGPNLIGAIAFPNLSRFSYLWAVLMVMTSPLWARSGGPYSWPIRTDRFLSATFGEPRAGHFHSGVDIKTWGALDIPCQAIADGYIARVRTGYTGYGKVLYLKLRDGRTAVYGHLDRFTWEIERRVWQRQAQVGRYAVELNFAPQDFPVKRNAILAYSGTSGTRHPHLHFEIRDSTGAVLNPLQFYRGIKDHRPPQLQELFLIPLAPQTRLNGGQLPLKIALKHDRWGYRARSIPYVAGTFGLSAAVFDRADGTRNWYTIYALSLTVDDSLAFVLQFQREPLSYAHQVKIVYEANLAESRKPVLNLFLPKSSPALPFVPDSLDGRLHLTPGLHDLRAQFRDFQGNKTEVTLPIIVLRQWPHWTLQVRDDELQFSSSLGNPGPLFLNLRQHPARPRQVIYELSQASWRFSLSELPQGLMVETLRGLPPVGLYYPEPVNLPDIEAHWEQSRTGWLMRFTAPAPAPFPAQVLLVTPWESFFLPLSRVSPTECQSSTVNTDLRAAVKEAVLFFGPGQELHFPQHPWLKLGAGDSYSQVVGGFDLSFSVEATADSFHLSVDTALAAYDHSSYNGLGLYTLEKGVEFTARMAFRLPPGADQHRWGIYRQAGGLKLIPKAVQEAGYLSVTVNKPGRYFLLADDSPPRIRLLTRRKIYRPGQRVVWRIRDNVGPITRPGENILMRWDGRVVFPNWNPLRHELTFHIPPDATPGRHRAEIRVTDQQGWVAKKKYRFRLRS